MQRLGQVHLQDIGVAVQVFAFAVVAVEHVRHVESELFGGFKHVCSGAAA